MLKNKYKIIDDYVIIYVDRSDGKTYEVLIDLEDLVLIDSLQLSIHIWINNGNGKPYARITDYFYSSNGRHYERIDYIHRLIMGVEGRQLVDHIDASKTLDNRKKNLRVAKKNENCKNRSSKNSNNKSGYRNVCYNKAHKTKPWQVQVQINNKNTVLGRFDDVDEAGIFAEEMRQKHYGEYAGES